MNTHHRLPAASAVAIALLAALFFLSAHGWHDDVRTVPTAIEQDQSHAAVVPADHAFADIYEYATTHLGDFHELPETYGEQTDWHGWHLQWVDVEHENEIIRIYHAASEEHPEIHFVTMCDSHNSDAAAWIQVH